MDANNERSYEFRQYLILQCKNPHCKAYTILPDPILATKGFSCDVCSSMMEQLGRLSHKTVHLLVHHEWPWKELEKDQCPE